MAEAVAAPLMVRLAPEESCSAAEVAILLLTSASTSSSSSLTVSAPISWLSRIPYFATCCKEPWSSPSLQQHHITLECTSGSSPAAYLRCLRLLDGSPLTQANVTEILELLPVADHLLFQECWDACMECLAGLPWSEDEDSAIRATLAVLNLKPSDDVCERLDTSHDVASLETVLRGMQSTESALIALSQEFLQISPAPIRKRFHNLILEMQASHAYEGLTNEGLTWLPSKWYVLTKLLLKFTDAREVIVQLIDSQLLSVLVTKPNISNSETDNKYIINEVFQRVLSRLVPLSNRRRGLLVTQTKMAASSYKNMDFEVMRQRVAETLPLGHSARIDLVKRNSKLSTEWVHQLFCRNHLWDGQQLEALGAAMERVLSA